MNSQGFAEIIEEQLDRCRQVLGAKASEYSMDDDRLHNFKVAAALQDETLIESLLGMLAKHTVSVFDMGRSAGNYSMDIWDEKITDHLNYLLLLKAALEELYGAREVTPEEAPEFGHYNDHLNDTQSFEMEQ